MGDNVLTLVTAIDTKGMEKGFEAIKKGTVNTAKAVTKTLNTISDTIKKLASIYVLKNVFDKLKNYLDTTIRKNREFAASMKNLRGSMAAAFQPIYETIAPGLIYLVQVLNYAVQAVGRFIAAISGKSYAQMLKNAQALSKQKDALDGVGGAAADAQRQLMGFDEINKLNEPGAGTGMSFNELDLGSMGGAIDDFAKRLRDLILSGQFQQAGDLVANAANQIISSLDLSAIATRTAGWINNLTEFSNAVGFGIDWNGLGKKFADGVSTFLATLNGYNLGRTLSLKFAIAIKTLSGFIKNLKWQTVGQTLSDSILGFAQGLGKTISQSLDSEFWETLNKNITDGFTAFAPGFIESLRIAVDTIAEQAPGVLQSIGNVGNQIVALINDSLSMMDEKVVIGKLDKFDDRGFQLNKVGSRWEMLGNSLAEGFRKIDFASIFENGVESAGKLTLGIITFIESAISGIGDSWTKIGEGIGKGLSDVDWSGIFTGAAVSLEKLSIGLCDLLTAALKGVVWSDVGAAIVDGICSINWKDLLLSFGDLMEELSYSLAELLIGVIDEAFGTHLIDKWQEFEAESRARSKESKEAFMAPDYSPSDDLQENLETLAEMVNNADATTKELNKMVQAIAKGGGTAEQIEEALSKIENQDAVKRFSELYIEPMKTGLDNAATSAEDLGTTTEDMASAVGTATSQVESDTSHMATSFITELNSMISKIVEFSGAFGSLSNMKLGYYGTTMRQWNSPEYVPYRSIPRMARGGVIPPNKEFLAVFGDQRSGNNIETPEALMRQIVREESGDSGIQTLIEQMSELIQTVSGISVGDETIGRAAARYNRKHGRAMGG